MASTVLQNTPTVGRRDFPIIVIVGSSLCIYCVLLLHLQEAHTNVVARTNQWVVGTYHCQRYVHTITDGD